MLSSDSAQRSTHKRDIPPNNRVPVVPIRNPEGALGPRRHGWGCLLSWGQGLPGPRAGQALLEDIGAGESECNEWVVTTAQWLPRAGTRPVAFLWGQTASLRSTSWTWGWCLLPSMRSLPDGSGGSALLRGSSRLCEPSVGSCAGWDTTSEALRPDQQGAWETASSQTPTPKPICSPVIQDSNLGCGLSLDQDPGRDHFHLVASGVGGGGEGAGSGGALGVTGRERRQGHRSTAAGL